MDLKKYEFIYALIVFLLFTAQGRASLDNSWCSNSVDLSSDFLPVKNQRDLGYCYAFAVTSLLENYAIRTMPQKEHKSFSALDAISQYYNSITSFGRADHELNTNYAVGGYPYNLLNAIQDRGLCSEDAAPYDQFNYQYSPRQSWDILVDRFNQFLMYNPNPRTPVVTNKCESNVLTETISAVQSVFDIVPRNEEVEERIHRARNGRDFLSSMLITDKCKRNREKLDYNVMYNGDRGTLRNDIVDNLNKGIPVIATVNCKFNNLCDFRTDGDILEDLVEEAECSVNHDCSRKNPQHAVIIKGVRQNPETQQCEFLIHNSWGDAWQRENNGGYVDAATIIASLENITWVE